MDGARLIAGVRGLADGPLDVMFWAQLNDVDPEGVSLALVSDLVGDRTLGDTIDEVVSNLEGMRRSRPAGGPRSLTNTTILPSGGPRPHRPTQSYVPPKSGTARRRSRS